MTDGTRPQGSGSPVKGSPLRKAALFVLSVGVCYAAAAVGSFFTGLSVNTWYPALVKPPLTPPGWVIGAIWTVLYFLMGVSLFLVLEAGTDRPGVRKGVALFSLQLVLNVAWSLLFFGLRSPSLGLVGIVLLWGAVAATVLGFRSLSRTAAYLLVPYLAWVTVAGILNAGILLLNP